MAKAEKNGLATKPIEATITVPGDVSPDGYTSDRVDVRSLTTRQARALKRMHRSLVANNARCQRRDSRTGEGTVVNFDSDSIRWLLDQIADEYEALGVE